jgi:hypothetical protein
VRPPPGCSPSLVLSHRVRARANGHMTRKDGGRHQHLADEGQAVFGKPGTEPAEPKGHEQQPPCRSGIRRCPQHNSFDHFFGDRSTPTDPSDGRPVRPLPGPSSSRAVSHRVNAMASGNVTRNVTTLSASWPTRGHESLVSWGPSQRSRRIMRHNHHVGRPSPGTHRTHRLSILVRPQPPKAASQAKSPIPSGFGTTALHNMFKPKRRHYAFTFGALLPTRRGNRYRLRQ